MNQNYVACLTMQSHDPHGQHDVVSSPSSYKVEWLGVNFILNYPE